MALTRFAALVNGRAKALLQGEAISPPFTGGDRDSRSQRRRSSDDRQYMLAVAGMIPPYAAGRPEIRAADPECWRRKRRCAPSALSPTSKGTMKARRKLGLEGASVLLARPLPQVCR